MANKGNIRPGSIGDGVTMGADDGERWTRAIRRGPRS